MSGAEVVEALSSLRLGLVASEYEIHAAIAECLRAAGLGFQREVKLGPRSRIDFLVGDGVGVEVKKGKVASSALRQQAERYAAFEVIRELVVVVERCVFAAPLDLGKPVHYVSLSKNWGIAL